MRRNQLLGDLFLFGAALVDPDGPALRVLSERITDRVVLEASQRNFRRVSLDWFMSRGSA
jgi:hypothetical protein